ncbi:hypothetical protein MMC25_001604 [Agyrium rufum]|nr:hypothetical protein [Agyrium rufum]
MNSNNSNKSVNGNVDGRVMQAEGNQKLSTSRAVSQGETQGRTCSVGEPNHGQPDAVELGVGNHVRLDGSRDSVKGNLVRDLQRGLALHGQSSIEEAEGNRLLVLDQPGGSVQDHSPLVVNDGPKGEAKVGKQKKLMLGLVNGSTSLSIDRDADVVSVPAKRRASRSAAKTKVSNNSVLTDHVAPAQVQLASSNKSVPVVASEDSDDDDVLVSKPAKRRRVAISDSSSSENEQHAERQGDTSDPAVVAAPIPDESSDENKPLFSKPVGLRRKAVSKSSSGKGNVKHTDNSPSGMSPSDTRGRSALSELSTNVSKSRKAKVQATQSRNAEDELVPQSLDDPDDYVFINEDVEALEVALAQYCQVDLDNETIELRAEEDLVDLPDEEADNPCQERFATRVRIILEELKIRVGESWTQVATKKST